MRSYVAVVTDRGPVDEDGNTPVGYAFDLPASPPTACTETVAFRYVVLGHRYEARIHGYELPADVLVPSAIGEDGCLTETKERLNANTGAMEQIHPLVRTPGSALLCTNPSGGESGPYEQVAPSWQRSCGTQGYGAAVARGSVEVPIGGCVVDGDNGNVGVGETAIVVDPFVAMAPQLACYPPDEVPPGEDLPVLTAFDIESFDVLPQGSSLPETLGLVCGSKANAEYTEVEPGTSYTFRVEAGNEEFPARWATTCTASAFEGVTVTASCDTLTDRGSVRFELGECPEGATYHLRGTNADGQVLSFGDGACPGPAVVSGVPSGRWDVTATIDVPDSEPIELTCTASVVPAANTDVECSQLAGE